MDLDLGRLMAQAQQLSKDLQTRQAELGRREVEGQSGAGMVTAVMSGRGELLRLRIDPRAYAQASGDVALLEDLIVAAVNAAIAEVQRLQQRELQSLAGGPFGGAFPAGFGTDPSPGGEGSR